MSHPYHILRATRPPVSGSGLQFDAAAWRECPVGRIDQFRPEGTAHCPRTRFKLQYDAEGLHGLFQVQDRYVRCSAARFQDPVCNDSCVEFFVQPGIGYGYLNFEFNASGVLLAHHVRDERRRPGSADFRELTASEVEGIRVHHTLQGVIDPERVGEITYEVGFFLPFTLFPRALQQPAWSAPVSGTVWRGNCYKCGDRTSHPHWASWRPVSHLNFHEPASFGTLRFD